MTERLSPTCGIEHVDVRERDLNTVDWESMDAVALFGGDLSEHAIARAEGLVVVGSATDNLEIPSIETL
ncbi:hypothetical protein V7793_10790 [Streptomyces sp. KLMMK]|uniref:hypothetical protein n=1 Tax=Streptomyces sp. KLMMK TaxID=3109353 RepID=UPI0030093F45